LGLELPLLHNSGVGMQSFIDLAGAANAEGVVFPMGKLVAVDALPDSDPQKAVLAKFVADYNQFIGKAPNQFAAHSFDAIQLVLSVLKTLPDGTPLTEQRAAVRNGIEATSGYVGLDGVFNLSAEDHVGLSQNDVVLVRIQDGKWSYFPQDQW
jgi:branched-chain amino acid transport system substrate-binding protein